MKATDANHDGRLTLAETIAAIQAWFPTADQNHDRLLNAKELGDAMDLVVRK